MDINLGFDHGSQCVSIPDKNVLKVLMPNPVNCQSDEETVVRQALENPIGSAKLSQIVKPGEKIAVITSDITRPMPTWKVMPLVLEELLSAGVQPQDITLVFALGSHRKMTDEERKKLAGEDVYAKIRCVDGDLADFVHIGNTRRGTPVDIVRTVAQADRRICLGNVEYHYFAGYSGGAKAIMPGVSTREAISANHTRMVSPAACAGKIEGNPVREDIEEAAAMVGVDFILNVVLDEHKKIIYAAAGDVTQAHRAGCKFLDTLYAIPIPKKADIVISSQGGAPKDLNLYQTQKALENAKYAVRDGGRIILVGSCKEGLGEKTFEEWLTQAPNPHSLVERISREFKLGGHKAAAIAMVLERAHISLVSNMPDDLVRQLFMDPYATVQEALDAAMAEMGLDADVIIMPYGGSTLPRCNTDEQKVE